MIEWLHLLRRLDELGEAIDRADTDKALDLLGFLVPGYRAGVALPPAAPEPEPAYRDRVSAS
jgi:hypothetical protein